MSKRIILAIVGRDVSGKDTVGAYLEEKYGFTQVITGQLVRDYIAQQELGEPTRKLMTKVANEVREKNGTDYFVQKALKLDVERLLINGARAIGEISTIRKAGGIVIAIDAPVKKRYEWSKGRGRTSDLVTFDEFARLEEFGSNNISENGVNVGKMVASADYTIHNDKSLAELYEAVDNLMIQLGIEKK